MESEEMQFFPLSLSLRPMDHTSAEYIFTI